MPPASTSIHHTSFLFKASCSIFYHVLLTAIDFDVTKCRLLKSYVLMAKFLPAANVLSTSLVVQLSVSYSPDAESRPLLEEFKSSPATCSVNITNLQTITSTPIHHGTANDLILLIVYKIPFSKIQWLLYRQTVTVKTVPLSRRLRYHQ